MDNSARKKHDDAMCGTYPKLEMISMETKHHCLIDHYERRLNYLRISITDRCNLRCRYCMPPEGLEKLQHEDILTYEEILRLARIAVGLGVDKIRLTGGEPLVRKDFPLLLPELMAIPGLKDVSLTTNGIYLKEHLESIRSAGVKRINISLDSLKGTDIGRLPALTVLTGSVKPSGWRTKWAFIPSKSIWWSSKGSMTTK
jgi:uncharacterized radical SAM superfamily Fe-S cluster-containing enzyme